MSEVKVNKISPRSGTTITLGDSGDTFTVPSGVTFDASSGGLAGTLTTAAQPNITSVGTLTSFASTGIDDNATSTAITIDSNENVGIGTSSPGTLLELASSQPVIRMKDTDNASYAHISLTSFAGLEFNTDVGNTRVATDIKFLVDNSEAMRIDSSGNVAIGTTSGNKQLTLESSGSNCGIRINNSVSGRPSTIAFDDSNDLTIWNNSTNGNTLFYNGTGSGIERMRIDSDGNVIINDTTTGNEFAVGTNAESSGVTVSNASGVIGQIRILKSYSGATAAMIFKYTGGGSSTTVGSIGYTDTSTSYNTSSDYRLKENVSYDFDATTRLKQLKPARFNFIADADKTVDGFLAHEVSSIVPEAISGEKDAVDENGNPEYQGIDQSKLVPLLVKTIQELEARITALENA